MPRVVKKNNIKKNNNSKIKSSKNFIFRKITEIEKLNYFLYLIIVVFAGLVFFVVSFFTTQRIVEVSNYNEVDRSFELLNITDNGVDVSVKSRDEVKVRYYVGTSPEVMALFSETGDFVREDYFQFRTLIDGKSHFIQVEFEKLDGTTTKSRIVEIK
jgi:hypothetical protein